MRMQLRGWQYIRRLREIADKCETVDPGQVPALRLKADIYKGLLAKCLPDLKAIEHSGTVTHKSITEYTRDELIAIASRAGATEADGRAGEPAAVHSIQ